jgi:MFS transporter, ACS family, tartrate transporter
MQGNSDDTALERATVRRITWRLMPFLLLLYIISWLDRINVSFAKLQLNVDLGFSDTIYGIGAGIFFVGYGLCEVPSNLLLVRYGARLWIARIMITWGIISTAMMFVEGTTSFYVMRFLLGVAEAGFLPGIIYYLTHWFPRQHRAKAVSWFMIGIPLSLIFGNLLSGWLMESLDEYMGLHGWQWMFLIEGIPAVILGFVVLGYLTEKPADAKWLPAEQRDWLTAKIAAEQHEAHTRHGFGLRAALTHPTVWLLAIVMFCCQAGSYGLSFYTPTIVKGLTGHGEIWVGILGAIPYVAAAAAMVLVSMSSDRSGERFLHIAIPSVIGAAGFVAVGYIQVPMLALVALSVAAAGDYCTRGPFWALPGKFLSGTAAAGGIALINSMGAAGGAVAPPAVGWLKDNTGGFLAPMLMLAAVLVVGAILTMFLRRSALMRD